MKRFLLVLFYIVFCEDVVFSSGSFSEVDVFDLINLGGKCHNDNEEKKCDNSVNFKLAIPEESQESVLDQNQYKNNFSALAVTITYNSNGTTSSTFCRSGSNAAPIITGTTGGVFTSSPAGLVFTDDPGDGTSASGEIDVSNSSAGRFEITYSASGGAEIDTHTVDIINSANPSFSYEFLTYCVDGDDPSPIFVEELPLGSTHYFLQQGGPSGLVISLDGVVDLSESPVGTYFLRRFIFNACGSPAPAISNDITITITDSGDASFTYAKSSYCKNETNPIPLITGTSGGVFSSTDSNLVFANSATGEIDLSSTIPGVYPIVYTVVGACSAVSPTQNITITGNNASFSYTTSQYCSADADPTPVIAGDTGGTFTNSSNSGLVIDGVSGIVDLDASAFGVHEIQYAVGATCSDTRRVNLEIIESRVATIDYSAAFYCLSDVSNPIPLVTGAAGGVFSSTAGLVFSDTATGEIDLMNSTPGDYTITYEISGTCGISTNDTVSLVEDNPSLSFETSIDDDTYTSNPTLEVSVEIDNKLEIRIPETFSGTVSWTGPNGFSATGTEILISNSLQLNEGGVYNASVTFDQRCGSAPISYDFTVNVINNILRVSPRVFLEGAMAQSLDNMMTDALRSGGYLPLNTPYTDDASVDASVFADATNDNENIVDWIWVELRDAMDSSIIIDSQSALLRKDGQIVAADGLRVTPLVFRQVSGNYYVAIHHRNHLGVRSSGLYSLSSVTTVVDLSSNIADVLGGANVLKNVGGGKYGIISGDYDNNGQIQVSDLNNVIPFIGSSGYSSGDLDMNGQIQVIDINNVLNPNLGKGEQL